VAKRRKYNKSRRDLFCYGCSFSDDDGGFPGRPEFGRALSPCLFCMRNPEVEHRVEIMEPLEQTVWPDGTTPTALPMDCYCPEDMYDQFHKWLTDAIEDATQAQLKADIAELKREYGIE
jgi:hypothetical protein